MTQAVCCIWNGGGEDNLSSLSPSESGVALIHIWGEDKALYKSGWGHTVDFIIRKDLREKSEQCYVENYFSVFIRRQE